MRAWRVWSIGIGCGLWHLMDCGYGWLDVFPGPQMDGKRSPVVPICSPRGWNLDGVERGTFLPPFAFSPECSFSVQTGYETPIG